MKMINVTLKTIRDIITSQFITTEHTAGKNDIDAPKMQINFWCTIKLFFFFQY